MLYFLYIFCSFRYSTFEYSGLKLAPAISTAVGGKCTATATVTVTNTGKVASREVAQLYLNRPGSPAAPWALRGYGRTAVLAPGASAALAFSLTAQDLSTVRADGGRAIPAGTYTIKVGGGNPRDRRVPALVAASASFAGCTY